MMLKMRLGLLCIKLGFYCGLVVRKAKRERDDAAAKADKSGATFILLECAEADIAREASHEPRLGAFLLAVRKSVAAWKDSHLACKTAAEACQATVDSIHTLLHTFEKALYHTFDKTLDADDKTLDADAVKDAVKTAVTAATNALSLSNAAHAHAINVHNELRLAGKVVHTLALPPMPGFASAVKADLL